MQCSQICVLIFSLSPNTVDFTLRGNFFNGFTVKT